MKCGKVFQTPIYGTNARSARKSSIDRDRRKESSLWILFPSLLYKKSGITTRLLCELFNNHHIWRLNLDLPTHILG